MVTYTWGTGRRKSSVARVRLKEGSGVITVNGNPAESYFSNRKEYISKIYRPLLVIGLLNKYDVFVNVHGGGTTGQAGAISLGISRALVSIDERNKPTLKHADFLTRDPRMVERKKYGKKKARKSGQFSKR